MPHVMRFHAETHAGRYVDVVRALGIGVEHLTPPAAAEAAIECVEILTDSLAVPSGLHALGVDPARFDRFACNALRDVCITTNPRLVTEDDVHRICAAAY